VPGLRLPVAALAGALMLATCGCAPTVAADARFNVAPYAPPVRYRAWFAEAERCSGLHRGRVEAITWLVTDSTPPLAGAPGWVEIGRFLPPDTIRIARPYVGAPWTVMHEVLHYLIGHGGHPAVPFQTCGVADAFAWDTRQVLDASLHGEGR
jgi:hypothetical protein